MHIWVRQTAGGQAAQVTRGGDDEAAPDFSPDGTQIVFRSERDGGGIYTASTLGGGEPQLLVKGGANPRFSPNGKDVLFFSDDLWAPKAYIVSRLGGPPRQVCPNWATDYGFWAPDGSAILFHGGRKGYMDDPIWMLASVAGGEPTKFHLPGDVPHVFAWRETRDGRQWVLFGSGAGDTYNLFRIAVGHGRLAANPEQLTAGAGVSPDFSQRRPWLSGAPVHVKFSAAGPKKDVHFCNVYYAEVRTGRPRADQRTANTMSALR